MEIITREKNASVSDFQKIYCYKFIYSIFEHFVESQQVVKWNLLSESSVSSLFVIQWPKKQNRIQSQHFTFKKFYIQKQLDYWIILMICSFVM